MGTHYSLSIFQSRVINQYICVVKIFILPITVLLVKQLRCQEIK